MNGFFFFFVLVFFFVCLFVFVFLRESGIVLFWGLFLYFYILYFSIIFSLLQYSHHQTYKQPSYFFFIFIFLPLANLCIL